jgi:hypothetical protein
MFERGVIDLGEAGAGVARFAGTLPAFWGKLVK